MQNNVTGMIFTPKFLEISIRQFADSDLDVLILSARKEKTRRKRAASLQRSKARAAEHIATSLVTYKSLISAGTQPMTLDEFKDALVKRDLAKITFHASVDELCDFSSLSINAVFLKKHLRKQNSVKYFIIPSPKGAEDTFIVLNDKYLYSAYCRIRDVYVYARMRSGNKQYCVDLLYTKFISKI